MLQIHETLKSDEHVWDVVVGLWLLKLLKSALVLENWLFWWNNTRVPAVFITSCGPWKQFPLSSVLLALFLYLVFSHFAAFFLNTVHVFPNCWRCFLSALRATTGFYCISSFLTCFYTSSCQLLYNVIILGANLKCMYRYSRRKCTFLQNLFKQTHIWADRFWNIIKKLLKNTSYCGFSLGEEISHVCH